MEYDQKLVENIFGEKAKAFYEKQHQKQLKFESSRDRTRRLIKERLKAPEMRGRATLITGASDPYAWETYRGKLNLSEQTFYELLEVYYEFDVNLDGSISRKEFYEAMKSLGQNPSDHHMSFWLEITQVVVIF